MSALPQVARAVGGLVGIAGLAGASVAWHARYRAPYTPQVERISLKLPPGHDDLAGLRIAFVTDCHVGPSFSAGDLARNLTPLAEEPFDLALFGGDYASESTRFAGGVAAVLGDLADRARYGGLAVLGNHDCAIGGHKVAAALEGAGIRTLRNEAVPVPGGRTPLWVVGLDDALLGKPDPAAAFAAIPEGAAALALWHEPDFAGHTARAGAFAQLSGHSHGGQVRFPGVGPLVLPPGGRRFIIGWHEVQGMPVYTSRGIGVYRPPVRFRCPPELTIVTLV